MVFLQGNTLARTAVAQSRWAGIQGALGWGTRRPIRAGLAPAQAGVPLNSGNKSGFPDFTGATE